MFHEHSMDRSIRRVMFTSYFVQWMKTTSSPVYDEDQKKGHRNIVLVFTARWNRGSCWSWKQRLHFVQRTKIKTMTIFRFSSSDSKGSYLLRRMKTKGKELIILGLKSMTSFQILWKERKNQTKSWTQNTSSFT